MATRFHFLSQLRLILHGIIFACLLLQAEPLLADEENERANKIKIAYLFHFAQFTEWTGKLSGFNYCIYDDANFTKLLKTAYADKTLNGSEVNVRFVNTESNLSDCQLIYFPNDAPGNVFIKINKKPILTVGTQNNFIGQNGMIYMYEKDQKIRFFINNASVQESGLKISSQLLSLSKDATQ